jgi:ketosteroid isomerase-like protein
VSQENVERGTPYEGTLWALFREWERGNFTAGTDLLAPDIRYSAAQPEGQVRAYGRTEMLRFLRGFFAAWDRYWIELHALEELRPGVFLATATQHGLGKGSGVPTAMPAFIATRFRDGLIVQLEFFYERDGALKAVGLEE